MLQARAEETCQALSDEYETKLRILMSNLRTAHETVTRLNEERIAFEETMKKAFMRGTKVAARDVQDLASAS